MSAPALLLAITPEARAARLEWLSNRRDVTAENARQRYEATMARAVEIAGDADLARQTLNFDNFTKNIGRQE